MSMVILSAESADGNFEEVKRGGVSAVLGHMGLAVVQVGSRRYV